MDFASQNLAIGPLNASKPTVLKTIKVGTGPKDAIGFLNAVVSSKCHIGSWAKNMLGQRKIASIAEREVDLIAVSATELGRPSGAPYEEICALGLGKGFRSCPEEVGPQLRLQYLEQPKRERLRVVMTPIVTSDFCPRVFEVGHNEDGGLYLDGVEANPATFCEAETRFLFELPRR